MNVRNDMFYLQANVIDWVRQAWDYLQQNGSNMMAVRWLELTASPATASSRTRERATGAVRDDHPAHRSVCPARPPRRQ